MLSKSQQQSEMDLQWIPVKSGESISYGRIKVRNAIWWGAGVNLGFFDYNDEKGSQSNETQKSDYNQFISQIKSLEGQETGVLDLNKVTMGNPCVGWTQNMYLEWQCEQVDPNNNQISQLSPIVFQEGVQGDQEFMISCRKEVIQRSNLKQWALQNQMRISTIKVNQAQWGHPISYFEYDQNNDFDESSFSQQEGLSDYLKFQNTIQAANGQSSFGFQASRDELGNPSKYQPQLDITYTCQKVNPLTGEFQNSQFNNQFGYNERVSLVCPE